VPRRTNAVAEPGAATNIRRGRRLIADAPGNCAARHLPEQPEQYLRPGEGAAGEIVHYRSRVQSNRRALMKPKRQELEEKSSLRKPGGLMGRDRDRFPRAACGGDGRLEDTPGHEALRA
jgi:hypothetical protein